MHILSPSFFRPLPRLLCRLLPVLGLLFSAPLFAEDLPREPIVLTPSTYQVGKRLPSLRFTDIDGKTHTSADAKKHKAVVFALTNTTCPLCRKHGPTLGALSRKYSEKGIPFVFVNPAVFEEEHELRADIKNYGFVGPYIHDDKEALAITLRALTTADAFVMLPDQTLVYRGAVDDRYGLGFAREKARNHFLADALDAVLAGKPVPQPATWAPGCALDLELDPPAVMPKGGHGAASTAASALSGAHKLPVDIPSRASLIRQAAADKLPPAPDNLTYHNRIAHIMQDNCVSCHRKGAAGPFTLDTYERVIAKRGMIKEVVADDMMPPWFAAPGEHAFANDRSLAPADKRDLLAWLATDDRPEGDPADGPELRSFNDNWSIGKPDAIIEIPREVTIQAEGLMDYVNLTVKTDFGEDKWLRGVQIRPTQPEAVHHVLAFAWPGKRSRKAMGPLDQLRLALTAEGGFLAGYVPGTNPGLYPEGTAKFLPAGATIRFQLHYTPIGKELKDRTRLGLVFGDAPPERELFNAPVQNTRIRIPAGVGNHREFATRKVPMDIEVLSFMPHMHVRGKAFRYELVRPDRSLERILDVPHYDFNWQMFYTLEKPLKVAAGSTLRATGWFDNSEKNPYNPDPRKTVRWGEQTTDEMLIGYVDFTVNSKGE